MTSGAGILLDGKRPRFQTNAYQTEALNLVFFERTMFPTTEVREKMAEILQMPARAVQIWFQNRRQKLKGESRDVLDHIYNAER